MHSGKRVNGMSEKKNIGEPGLRRLVEKFKQEFKQPENTGYYSQQDYAVAEKRYIYHRLNRG